MNCCGKLAQTEYKKQDDNLGKIVHWKLARKCDFEAGGKWHEHESKSVLEKEDYKILMRFQYSDWSRYKSSETGLGCSR